MISRSITNKSLQKFKQFVTYLHDTQWPNLKKNMLPHPGAALPPHIPHFSKYMISLVINNGYLQSFQEVVIRSKNS